MVSALVHKDEATKNDETLAKEAHDFLARSPTHQALVEILAKLRELDLPWWQPERLRETFTATDRMRWLKQRPDLRQQITTKLTGLPAKAARKKEADFQAALVDSVIDDGDIDSRTFEEAFDLRWIVVYGDVARLWWQFREAMPWSSDVPVHQELVATILDGLLAGRGSFEGRTLKPILTPWDVRTAIDGRVWHLSIPLEVRVRIDEERLSQEKAKPREPFHAKNDLAIATSRIITTNVKLADLVPVFDAAEKAMGLDRDRQGDALDQDDLLGDVSFSGEPAKKPDTSASEAEVEAD